MVTDATIAVDSEVKAEFEQQRQHTDLTQNEFLAGLLDGGLTVEELKVVPIEEVRADE